jgi:hypothetical protein
MGILCRHIFVIMERILKSCWLQGSREFEAEVMQADAFSALSEGLGFRIAGPRDLLVTLALKIACRRSSKKNTILASVLNHPKSSVTACGLKMMFNLHLYRDIVVEKASNPGPHA